MSVDEKAREKKTKRRSMRGLLGSNSRRNSLESSDEASSPRREASTTASSTTAQSPDARIDELVRLVTGMDQSITLLRRQIEAQAPVGFVAVDDTPETLRPQQLAHEETEPRRCCQCCEWLW